MEIPSILKIRFIALVFCFICVFTFIGFVNWCFAQCTMTYYSSKIYDLDEGRTLAAYPSWSKDGCSTVVPDSIDYDGPAQFDNIITQIWSCEGGFYEAVGGGMSFWAPLGSSGDGTYSETGLNGQPCVECLSCAEEEFICQDIYPAGIFTCAEDADGCAIQSECLPPPDCASLEADCLAQVSESYSCDFSCSQDAEGNVTSSSCNCVDTGCDERRDNCASTCGGTFGIQLYLCEPYTCECTDNPDDPEDIDNTPDLPNESGDPDDLGSDAGEEGLDSAPDDTDSASLSKIVDNTSDIASNTSKIVDNTNDLLGNSAIIATTLDRELNELNSNIEKLGHTNEEIVDGLGLIDDQLEQINSGEVLKYIPLNDFQYDQTELDQSLIHGRISSFFDTLKTSELFSLTSSPILDIPDSSVSIFSIDAGSYGLFEVDFSLYETSLSYLKYVLLTGFSWFAIRVLVSKK